MKFNEIVLYKDDKAIVLYSNTGNIKAVPLYNFDSKSYECSNNVCPLCGSILSGSRYTYIAKTYFYLLQRSFQNWKPTRYINIFNDHDDHKELPVVDGSIANDHAVEKDLYSLYPSEDISMSSTSKSIINAENIKDDVLSDVINTPLTTHDDNLELSYRRLIKSPRVELDYDLRSFDDEYTKIDEDDIEPPKNIPKELLVTGYYKRFFLERKKLGFGSFGHVYYCIHVLDELVLGEYAVKKLAVGDDMNWLRKIIREVKVREHLRHRNIVDYNHSWLEMYRLNELCPYVPWLFILMEYCNGGDLENFINNIYKIKCDYLNNDEIWVIFYDILNGLCHLHRHGVIYRDLKASNVLLSFTTDEFRALLSDFGTAEILAELRDGKTQRKGYTGTIEYTAPELLSINNQGEFNGNYDTKTDIWSLGIILYFLSYGTIPYYHIDPKICRNFILAHTTLKLSNQFNRPKILKMLILILTHQVC